MSPPSARRVVLATHNEKKKRELVEIVARGVEIASLADLGLSPTFVEDAPTFEGNAAIKVRATREALSAAGALDDVWAILADDSGIVVDALDGRPGVRSARYAMDAGRGEGDAANNQLLLDELEGVPEPKRTARYACAICVLWPATGEERVAFGTVEGRIARAPRGDGGFGYDPYFLPIDAPGRHMAELTAEEKHRISHRGRAVREALSWLLP